MNEGILIIDKPVDWTSHDVVGKLRKLLRTKRIGHTGTLDPFATGVLVMLVGKATRLAQFLDKDVKEYEAVIQFGFETDTGDLTGTETVKGTKDKVSAAEIEPVLQYFRGEISQVPPMYSAKKVDGQKLYNLARQGIEIERKPVNITIYNLELLETNGTTAKIRVACSAGTYIRTLAEDIGRKLEICGHLTSLRRIRAGKFEVSQAVKIEEVENAEFISMNDAVSHLFNVEISAEEIIDLGHGKKLFRELNLENNTVRITDEAKTLLAIGQYDNAEKSIQPKIVFL
jgi:tRNA pseudouridine55 synthase